MLVSPSKLIVRHKPLNKAGTSPVVKKKKKHRDINPSTVFFL